jgi:hypothetical protein
MPPNPRVKSIAIMLDDEDGTIITAHDSMIEQVTLSQDFGSPPRVTIVFGVDRFGFETLRKEQPRLEEPKWHVVQEEPNEHILGTGSTEDTPRGEA